MRYSRRIAIYNIQDAFVIEVGNFRDLLQIAEIRANLNAFFASEGLGYCARDESMGECSIIEDFF